MIHLLQGDARDLLPRLPAASIHCCVTSPPYLGLRDYGTARWEGGDPACDHAATGTDRGTRPELPNPPAGWAKRAQGHPVGTHCPRCNARRIDQQLGLEANPETYLAQMVALFREVRRVLRPDGTLWLNIGDSHRDKQLQLMPARLALALQADGWFLRADIIWHKPNPMPESVLDRPTSAHEHIFLLTKAARYFYDAEAIRESSITNDPRRPYTSEGAKQLDGRVEWKSGQPRNGEDFSARNARNVWTISTEAYPEAHFATFPTELAERCIKAGCPKGGTVLDPFAGAGTTLLVADRLQRHATGIELSPTYARMIRKRLDQDAPLLALMQPPPPPEPPPEEPRQLTMVA